jgi:hypothetical protein
MLNVDPAPILRMDAYIWNGKQKLLGKLVLTNESLEFILKGFEESRLLWRINRNKIRQAKDFLVYDVARQGLKITGDDGKSDLFVFEKKTELSQILKVLNQKIT